MVTLWSDLKNKEKRGKNSSIQIVKKYGVE